MTSSLEGGGLRVEFVRRGDRWSHTIGVVENGHFTPVLESVEGTPDEAWPASPALQELHFEDRGDRRVALLVGTAGSTHWSMSVELDPRLASIQFEVACRLRSTPVELCLGSSYTSKLPIIAIDGQTNIGPFVFESSSRAIIHAARVTISAVPSSIECPQTCQWRYVVGTLRVP